ncbi:MAG: M13 family peptidase, partial [Bacteroidetes bacterium]|nr:M13 family peptidase [Bacteroidota bacterium]
MYNNIYKIFLIASVITLASCGDAKKETTSVKNTGIDIANTDSTMKPTDDFYQFVNGNWIKNNPIPESESRWSTFDELREKNTARLKIILEEVAAEKNVQSGSNKQKIGDFYSLAMDSAKLNKDGVSPLKDEFDAIDKIVTTPDLIKVVAHLQTIGIGPMFNAFVDQDPKISTEYITQFYQGGLG